MFTTLNTLSFHVLTFIQPPFPFSVSLYAQVGTIKKKKTPFPAALSIFAFPFACAMPVIIAVDKRLHNVYSHHPQTTAHRPLRPAPFRPQHDSIFRNGQCKFAADAVIAAHYGQANVAIAICQLPVGWEAGNMDRTRLIRQMQHPPATPTRSNGPTPPLHSLLMQFLHFARAKEALARNRSISHFNGLSMRCAPGKWQMH